MLFVHAHQFKQYSEQQYSEQEKKEKNPSQQERHQPLPACANDDMCSIER
jgi:hypothetical protein